MGQQNPLAATIAKNASNEQTQLETDASGNLKVAVEAGTGNAVAATNSGTAAVAGYAAATVAGALYGATVQNLGTATVGGFAMVLNSGTVPATGTLASGVIADVLAVGCGTVPGAGTARFDYGENPLELSAGATIVFSSTAPPVMTTVAGGMFGTVRFKSGA